MAELKSLQERFQNYLLNDAEDFPDEVVSTGDATAAHRLAVYFNAYRIRLLECLESDFSNLSRYLQTEKYEQLMLAYLKAYPSADPSVRWLGQHLIKFLRANPAYNEDGFLAELAAFEWQQGLAFDAVDAKVIKQVEDMAEIPADQWPYVSFEFAASVATLDFLWNVNEIWMALENEEPVPEKNKSEIPVRWVIWRKQLTPNWRSLDVDEAVALEMCLNGANFSEVCEGLLEWYDEENVSLRFVGLLQQWLSDELVTEIIYPIQVTAAADKPS